ncbi:MAG: tail fiber protein [Bacteroidales bacterium]|nr:tail fiber protein [Bacteroidales bacterium]
MKKIYFFAMFLVVSLCAIAQAPESFNYQAVVRDAAGQEITGQLVGIQISLLQTTASGTAVYVERFTPTTNDFGLITLDIGDGIVQSGDFSVIDWSSDLYFIKVEMDENGGTTYVEIGTSQLLSVPYSLYSNRAGQLSIGDTWLKNGSKLYFNDDNVGIGIDDPLQKLHIRGNGSYIGTDIVDDSNDWPSFLLTGSFPNIIIGSNGNTNHGATLGFWNFDGDATTLQWNLGGGQDGNFSIGFARNSSNPHCGINGLTESCTDALTPLLINPQGNVGINQINPQYDLDVNGDVNVSGNLKVDGDLDIDVSSIIADILPAGMIVPFAGDAGSVPDGWLLCDGSEVSRTSYDRLFNTISVNYGYGDNSTTFNLPDLRGRFLRGVDNGSGNDPDAASRTASNAGGNSGDAIGSWQPFATGLPTSIFSISAAGQHNHTGSLSAAGNHSHTGLTSSAGGHGHTIYGDGSQLYLGDIVATGGGQFHGLETGGGQALTTSSVSNHFHSVSINTAGNHSHTLSINTTGNHNHILSGGDNETRPQNVYVNYIIKY